MEYGFFHPDRGYWQATSKPSAETLAGYPDGTVSVPLKYCPTPPKPWPQSVKLRSKRRCRIWKPSVWRRSVRKLKPSWRVPRPSRKVSNSETCAAPAVKPGPEDDWPMVMILSALLFFLSVPSLIGLLVIYHVARPQKAPADTSNRINKVRLFWFALTREDVLAPHIPWLGRDELDNVSE